MDPIHLMNACDSERELAAEIEVSEETLQKVAEIALEKRKGASEVIRYLSSAGHQVFSLKNLPHLIFKASAEKGDPLGARHKKTILAAGVISTQHLSLLKIPYARLYRLNTNEGPLSILAEEKLDFEPDPTIQASLFEEHSNSIRQALIHLGELILATGFSDVDFRNIPILRGNPPKKIGLIDLEEMEGAAFGIYGNSTFRRGLIRCTTPTTGSKIHKMAKEKGVIPPYDSYEKIERMRREEISKNGALKKFHIDHGIVLGDEPIKNIEPDCKKVVDALNQAILSSTKTPLAERRSIHWAIPICPERKAIFKEYEVLFKKLREKGAIFDFVLLPGQGYRIQA